ncbi:MAG: hypothetical protein ACJATI_003224 [Halioglobus sp.]|jgi:hypothetical protein
MMISKYDIIGDIHGHATQLKNLLTLMGYENNNGYFQHESRKVIFVGDYIDRGPEIREVLHIVKSMTDNDQAIALMGNHEYNCLCYHTIDSNGDFLRKHTAKNTHQHQATLSQFEDHQEVWNEYLKWMWTLPLWLNKNEFRVVHACWSDPIISKIKSKLKGNILSKETLIESADKSSDLYEWVEIALKGKELPLPQDITFLDKDKHPRSAVRIKWWMNAQNITYDAIKVNPEYDVPDILVDPKHPLLSDIYDEDAVPVFFGHYWLRGTPSIYKSNVCCLDYSVAKKGKLVAYSYNGESNLNNDQLVWCD